LLFIELIDLPPLGRTSGKLFCIYLRSTQDKYFLLGRNISHYRLITSTSHNHLSPSIKLLSDVYHSFDDTLWTLFIMRFNAVIAAYILAVTVSGAALPATEEAATNDVSAPAPAAPESYEEAPTEEPDYPPPPFVFDEKMMEEGQFMKRDASADAEAGWTWYPYRPYGLPIGKRSADAEAAPEADAKSGWTWYPYRPYGLPVGKRSADAEAAPEANAEAGWTWTPYRPYGLPIGKRDAEAAPEADARRGWTWLPYRPYGLPIGKRDAEAAPGADAKAGWTWTPYRPYGLPVGKREE
jgi:mating pheromone alpha-factor